MKYQYKKDSTKNLFIDAETNGQVTVELKSEREAKLYQFHLYNYRRLKGLSPVFSIEISSNPETGLKTRLTLFKQPEPEVKIVKLEPTIEEKIIQAKINIKNDIKRIMTAAFISLFPLTPIHAQDYQLTILGEKICAKSLDTCLMAQIAIKKGWFLPELAPDTPSKCLPHPNCFPPTSNVIKGYNDKWEN